ncbi:MAG: hypothetical protein RLZZ387_3416 [Chloroflexota bacterium]
MLNSSTRTGPLEAKLHSSQAAVLSILAEGIVIQAVLSGQLGEGAQLANL